MLVFEGLLFLSCGFFMKNDIMKSAIKTATVDLSKRMAAKSLNTNLQKRVYNTITLVYIAISAD